MRKELSQESKNVIEGYLSLPFESGQPNCPYFNNTRDRKRAGFAVQIGKGSPKEIIEEAQSYAIKERVDLDNLDQEALKIFLVNHKLGVDCSGMTYHILDAETKERGLGSLSSHVKLSLVTNPLRRLLARFRNNQNVSAATFAHQDNSTEIGLKDVAPGDIITMIGPHQTTGEELPNHILLIEAVDYVNDEPQILHYVHSIAAPEEGVYGHGMRRGQIEITDLNGSLYDQSWLEDGTQNDDIYVYRREQNAGRSSLRHPNWL